MDAGEWVQVTGGNGAGKTTLLRLLTGLARPDGGEVYWQGKPLRHVRGVGAGHRRQRRGKNHPAAPADRAGAPGRRGGVLAG
ncbi:ATP-binding cassette domain-containing protein [Salmonella enterica]|uniref:ATP-binding cassette domain-containing protein n=1 Tax=Salmonella enterica TaxID=28901 RepID=UPI0039B6E536